MLLSNLPMLMAMYEPGMQLASVVAYNQENSAAKTHVAGISLNLKDSDDGNLNALDLSSIREIGT